MNSTISLAISAFEALLPELGKIEYPSIQKVIAFLETAVPAAIQEGADLIQPVQNIIAALTGNGNVTADQVAALQAQSDALDAALDAAAKDDGLAGA